MPVTIVTYHFVRDLADTRFPNLNALDLAGFHRQLDHIQRDYQPITTDDLIDAYRTGDAGLPPKAIILTFDDGYIDHYEAVFPALLERGLHGQFFVPGIVLEEKTLLDANKIQMILAAVTDPAVITSEIFRIIDKNSGNYGLHAAEWYWEKHAKDGIFNPPEIRFIKDMLHSVLPDELRRRTVDGLFRQHVSSDESAIAEETYLGIDQLREMRQAGMCIGNHGYSHCWLDSLDRRRQHEEIADAMAVLTRAGVASDRWVMCYPHGRYDDSLLACLRESGCALGMTLREGAADPAKDDPLLLPRIDTNKLAAAA
jgi:peptidoglycan/xylan/chitin deacetylase (PgdA/CDA1 family)